MLSKLKKSPGIPRCARRPGTGNAITSVGDETPLGSACQRWLRARDRFHRHKAGGLKDFAGAEDDLFRAFAAEWSGTETMLTTAYSAFRQALRTVHEDTCRCNPTVC